MNETIQLLNVQTSAISGIILLLSAGLIAAFLRYLQYRSFKGLEKIEEDKKLQEQQRLEDLFQQLVDKMDETPKN